MKTRNKSNINNHSSESNSFPMRSILVCTAMLATTAFSFADVRLKGNVGPRVIEDDVIIERGTTCVLNGTTIKGNVRVRSGAKLYANGAWVDGSIFAYNAKLVDFRDSSRVTWNVRGNGTHTILLQDDTQIGGHVRLVDAGAPQGVDALLVMDSDVVGSVQVRESKGRFRILYNTIEGQVKLVNNSLGRFSIRDNEIFEDLLFQRNSGDASIIGNNVGGNLRSGGNAPMAKVKRNTVRGDTVNQ